MSHLRLREAHCDRLIQVLIDHEAHALDGFFEALQADYLEERGEPVVYVLVEPASHYYKTMTKSPRMPVLIGERI